MDALRISCIFFALFVISLSGSGGTTAATDEERKSKQVYIVYLGALPEGDHSPSARHLSMLQEVVDSSYTGKSLIRSYNRSFNGFAANLTNQEREKLAGRDAVALIFPSKTLQLQTTASWDFLRFPRNVGRNLDIESDIIIGVIDSGIWPESKSFSDHGFGPIPKKWKGVCKGGKNFTCNNKIVGARYYVRGDDSARDLDGHGSHTASTAAGNEVENASFYGIAQGIARGGVPSARISAYKVCSDTGCTDEDILAGFDDAIADGVDIITVSLGLQSPVGLQYDSIAIGSFHGIGKGVLTVQSAGNDGSLTGRVVSTAPWLFTVAASTTNRKLVSKIALGNGAEIFGNAINSFKLNSTKNYPLVYGKDASIQCGEAEAKRCYGGCLDRRLVEGKIVLCDDTFSSSNLAEVKRAGSVGSIFRSGEIYDVSFVFPSAASTLSPQQFDLVESYINSTKVPQAYIYPSENITDSSAPVVASFSSRGPNTIFPDILKPDISAPGVHILAAYSPAASPSEISHQDARSVEYNILSGTSMACPHAAGAAAYVKSLNPHWSPSAIKSALMTTAWQLNATNASHGDAEFSYGAGHLDPVKAADPGLVYEILRSDYIKLLCGLKLDPKALAQIFADNTSCTNVVPTQPKDLNYPTITAKVENGERFTATFSRTVTNVGLPNSTYRATITSRPSQVNISVEPNILSFTTVNEKRSFVVTVTGGRATPPLISASLVWFDGLHSVRSPIIIYT
ncbi:subtilisin-like protease SBT4.13 [Coffea eugenioides]|uniref:subtilisin-like protease SBT4.13 n=1 Tax=Coffea eugenioides TaxID=49369 RepID=UPI000F6125F2|nr:subtilisin-like protease SBT4.13 [Coffea eugenioides]